MDKESRTVLLNGVEVELRVDSSLQASALRAFLGTTPIDSEVDQLALPDKPQWLRACVKLLRWYRARISPSLGQRCVYEPTCSRYAELSLRKHGLARGLYYTLKRLHRCRPGSGGVDMP